MMKLVEGDVERFVVRPEELRKIFGSIEGVKFSGLWCLAWFGYCPSELTIIKPEDVNCEKVEE